MSLPRRPQKLALFQRIHDGFVFSSTRKRSRFDVTPLKLTGDVKELAIVSQPGLFEVPKLGTLCSDSENDIYRQNKADYLIGVQQLDYGPYSSFAPTFDSEYATVTFEESMILRSSRKRKRIKMLNGHQNEINQDIVSDSTNSLTSDSSPLTSPMTSTPTPPVGYEDSLDEANTDNLKSTSSELEEIPNGGDTETPQDGGTDLEMSGNNETIANGTHTNGTEDAEQEKTCDQPDMEKILEENTDLLRSLQRMQDERFSTKNPDRISKEERELALQIRDRLSKLVSQVPPSALASFEDIEKAAQRIPLHDVTFTGTLPAHKLYAYATNHSSSASISPMACTVPDRYAKAPAYYANGMVYAPTGYPVHMATHYPSY